MNKLLKIIFFTCGILILTGIVVFCVLYYLASNSLPDYNQQLKSTKIKHQVIISRDTYAIPYVFGKTDSDSLFALGYVHAQDRLWQMTLMRRTAQGKLSEIVGESAFESDLLMRTLNIYNAALESEKEQTFEIKTLLDSYSNGVNYYIEQISRKGLGRGSPEFFFVTPEISPWRPADTIALLKLLAFQSSNKAEMEVLRTELMLRKINPQRLNDLFDEPPLITNKQSGSISFLNKMIPNKTNSINISTNVIKNPPAYRLNRTLGASNIFAVMPSRSATGASIAATDPHTALTAPSKFMLVGLDLTTGPVIGGTIPGIPAILFGRGQNIGWGMASAHIDDQDLFFEKINQKNKSEYFTEFGLAPLMKKVEIIKVKNEKSIAVDIFKTHNGPILPLNSFGIEPIRPEGHEISINWTGLSVEDKSIEALMSIMRSSSINQAKSKLRLLDAPGQNILLVDKENVSIFVAGAVPNRSTSQLSKGKIPSLGWKDGNSWLGKLSYETNPKIENPESGIIVNTNNKTTSENFPYHLSYDWGDSQRIVRANNLLQKRQFHTVNSFVEIQTDTTSISARILLPLLAKNLWFEKYSSTSNDFSILKEDVLKILSAWSGDMNQSNSEPLIYVSWLANFQEMLMADELGNFYQKMTNIRPLFLERVLRNKEGASEWCDIIQTQEKESCEEISKRSLNAALKQLQKKFGSNINDWRWGDSHIAVHRSSMLGSKPILSFFTNIVHEISGGDNTIMMSRMLNGQKNNHNAYYGSTLRAIYDFSENDNSLFIISTGQSGHFLSKHYDDQSVVWQKQQYLPMEYDKTLTQGGSVGTTTFEPK